MSLELPRCNWDQAQAIHAWSPAAFAAVGIKPATVRKWASRNHIKPVAIGPNGCRLYDYEEVTKHADRHTSSSLEPHTSTCHTLETDGSSMPAGRWSA